MAALVLPTVADPVQPVHPLSKAFANALAPHLNDPRDASIARMVLLMTAVEAAGATALYVSFSWPLAVLYSAVNFVFFITPYTLLLHNVSHRPLFKRWTWANFYVSNILGMVYGQSPFTYASHHLGMHHAEGNLEGDLSSTMKYERDNFVHWLRYWARFFFLGTYELPKYHFARKHYALGFKALFGELFFLLLVGSLLVWNWQPTFVVFVLPFMLMRLAMMMGNWGQHAFVDPKAPDNDFVSSITCINTRYNKTCFNDGYHIGHHLKANRHWTELPGDFLSNAERYAKEEALVFDGIDFFQVWVLLMVRRYDILAKHVVPLKPEWADKAVVESVLRARTRPIVRTLPA